METVMLVRKGVEMDIGTFISMAHSTKNSDMLIDGLNALASGVPSTTWVPVLLQVVNGGDADMSSWTMSHLHITKAKAGGKSSTVFNYPDRHTDTCECRASQ